MIAAVIGKNFGDEGKGLAVDSFCSRVPHCLVVKHNGGAQAGHTVCFEGRRFVFHQLSSGSFRGADTYWATTYYPDLYKLREEIEEFLSKLRGDNTEANGAASGSMSGVSAGTPRIYASKDTAVTVIDDIILNMALETSRGDGRHGSCGMGINEADLRTKAGFALTFGELRTMDAESLTARLSGIRREYVLPRFKKDILKENGEEKRREDLEEYADLLENEEVLHNAAQEMMEALQYVEIIDDEAAFLRSRENIVFESGQGLLLDSKNKEFAPHVTASRTGLHNVGLLLRKAGMTLTEACYVSRTYVTRHGAGPLPCECEREKLTGEIHGEDLCGIREDCTNVGNPWQGSIRYAKHESIERFLAPVREDLAEFREITKDNPERVSLFLTHLNETGAQILLENGNIKAESLEKSDNFRKVFDRVYLSDAENAECLFKDFQ